MSTILGLEFTADAEVIKAQPTTEENKEQE
jgi:hypothetical protein